MDFEGMVLETCLVMQRHLANSATDWLVLSDVPQMFPSKVLGEISGSVEGMDPLFEW